MRENTKTIRIVIHADNWNLKEIESLSFAATDKYHIIWTFKNIELYNVCLNNTWVKKNVELVLQKTLDQFSFNDFKQPKNFHDALRRILSDVNIPLFYDRKLKGVPDNSMIHYYRYISKVLLSTMKFHEQYNPDVILFMGTPHNIRTWITALYAEYIGCVVLSNRLTALPFSLALFSGIGRKRKQLEFIRNDDGIKLNNKINSYIKEVSSNYNNEGIDPLQKARLNKNSNKLINIYADIKNYWYKPHYILNKINCFTLYCKISISSLPETKIALFLLHYQPEKTTLPEGYEFTQQFFAIKLLRIHLPDNYKIIVKEHPSTFTRMCDPKQRDISFYKAIKSLPNVDFVSMNFKVMELISLSSIVASISGTAGVEAAIKGVPAIYFGYPRVDDVEGVHVFENENRLASFLNKVDKGIDERNIAESIKQALYKQGNSSVFAETEHAEGRLERKNAYKRATLKLYTQFLKQEIKLP